jgi:hypothetical protein
VQCSVVQLCCLHMRKVYRVYTCECSAFTYTHVSVVCVCLRVSVVYTHMHGDSMFVLPDRLTVGDCEGNGMSSEAYLGSVV